MAQNSMSETSEILHESLTIINGGSPNTRGTKEDRQELQHILDLLEKMDKKLNKIDNLESRLTKIEGIFKRLDVVENKVTKCETSVCELERERKEVRKIHTEMDKDMSGLSNLFDGAAKEMKEIQKEVKGETKNMKKDVTDVKTKLNSNSDSIGRINAELEEVRDELKEDMLDLRCRSMRDNLLFCGIPEEEAEDCEETVRRFMCDKMRVRKDINFERVHRIGRKPSSPNARPRNIVAKFSHFKDRELVRKQAPKTLKGTNFYVQEQFPVEIDQRRRALFPVMREARRRNQRVRLMRDRLFIDGIEYTPSEGRDQPAHQPTVSPSHRQDRKRPRVGSS